MFNHGLPHFSRGTNKTIHDIPGIRLVQFTEENTIIGNLV